MLDRSKWHKSITTDVVVQVIGENESSLENNGLCLICGELSDGCEPDGQRVQCESCGADQVYGAEFLLLELA